MALEFKHPLTVTDLFEQAEKQELYIALINQLSKDFRLVGIEIQIHIALKPVEVLDVLHDKIFSLIQTNFASYLNLLYVIDIPENEIRGLDGSDVVELSKAVSFIILKRIWQKIWFKKFYS